MTISQELEQCIDKLKRGELTEKHLRDVILQLQDKAQGHQDLLYLQSQHSGVTGRVIGMSLVKNGVVSPLPDSPDEWPYQTVAAAIQDGWRVIQFPALVLDDERTYGLGYEFILEKWIQ